MIRVDYGPELGFLDFPDEIGEDQVIAYARANDEQIRRSLAIRRRAPALRELAQSETAVEAAPEGFSSGLETLGRGVAQQIGSIGQAVRAGAELERNLPGAQPMQALETLGLGDFLRSYAVTDAIPRQTPTLADVGQSFEEQGILGGAREAGAFAAGNIVEQTPNILASIATGGALSAAGVPLKLATVAAPFLTTLPVEAGGAFREIEERTGRADPTTAAIAMGVGGINAALESASDAPILGWAMKPVRSAITAPLARSVGRVVGGTLGEAATETGQELVTATAPELVGADRDPNLGMRALEAGAAGFVSGVPFAGAAEFQARRNEARYGTPAEGTPPVIQSDFDRAALSAQDQVAQVRQQADFAFTEAEKQAGFRLNEIDAQRQGVISQNQLNELEVNRLNLGAAAAKLNVLADLLEARSNIDGAVGQAEQTAAPVVDAKREPVSEPSEPQAEAVTDVRVASTSPSLKPVETLDLGNGFNAKIDPNAQDVRYFDSTGMSVGRLETAELPGGKIGVENHTLFDEARGKGFGQKAILRLSELTGRDIVSDQYPSDSARAMWERLGAKREDVIVGEEGEIQRRYVLKSTAEPQPLPQSPLTANEEAVISAAKSEGVQLEPIDYRDNPKWDATTVTSPVDEAVMGRVAPTPPVAPTKPVKGRKAKAPPKTIAEAEERIASQAAASEFTSQAREEAAQLKQRQARGAWVDSTAKSPAERVFANSIAAGDWEKALEDVDAQRVTPGQAFQLASSAKDAGFIDEFTLTRFTPPPTPPRSRSPLAKRKALGAAGKQAKRMAAMGSDALKDLDNLTPEEALQVSMEQGGQADPRATETNKTRFIKFTREIDGVINGSTLVNDMRSNDVAVGEIKDAVMREAVKSFEQAQQSGEEWTVNNAMAAAKTKIRQAASNIRRNKSFVPSQTSSLTTDEGNQSDVVADDEPIPPDATADPGVTNVQGAMTFQKLHSEASIANDLNEVERIALFYRSFLQQTADRIFEDMTPAEKRSPSAKATAMKKAERESKSLLPGIPALVKELALTEKIDTIFTRDVLPKVGDLLKSIAGNLKFALPQAQVVEAITAAFGSVPESVTIIDDPNHVLPDGKSGAGVAGYIVRSTGEITLNAAYIDSPMRAVMTLTEELVHGVWDNPLIQGAWKTVLATVTQEEIQAKVDEGYPVEQAREEVAVAKVLDYVTENNPTPGVIENFLSTLWGKLKELFGLGPQLDQARNEILQKAFEAMRSGPAVISRDLGLNSDFAIPPTDAEAIAALDQAKQPKFGLARDVAKGTPVALRIDIPAFNRTKKYVVTVHTPAGPSGGPGEVIGYDTISRVSNPRFVVKPGVERIFSGKSKKWPVATVDGQFNPDRSIPADINDWVPVGMDPTEHAFFYDKRNDRPVTGGDEAVSVGNTVFVRNPVYGSASDYRFARGIQAVRDAAYMAAVERGDTETAQRMVDEAAKRAGYREGWHAGGPTTAETARYSIRTPFHYLTSTPENASSYGWGNTDRWFFKLTNPMVVDQHMDEFIDVFTPGGNRYIPDDTKDYDMLEWKERIAETVEDSIAEAKKGGHDGFDMPSEWQPDPKYRNYIVLSPSQIKSADAITYDDSGAVIPLSRRFDEGSQDIRYSIAGPRVSEMAQPAENSATSTPLSDEAIAAFTEVDEYGSVIVKPDVLLSLISDGSIAIKPVRAALLSHLLRPDGRHALNQIELVESGNFSGRFKTRQRSDAGSIEISTVYRNGSRISLNHFAHVLTHELVHNAVTSKLDQSPEFRERAERLRELVKEKTDGTKWKGSYAMSDLSEFFAEGMANAEFRKFLLGIDYPVTMRQMGMPSTGRLSAFGGMLHLLKQALNLPTLIYDTLTGQAVESITALDELVDIAAKLESQTRRGAQAMMGLMEAQGVPSTSGDIRRSLTSGWFVNQATAQIAIARAQQQGADPTTIADVAQVEGELIPRSTVDTLERFSKGTKIQQAAASIAKILFDVGNLANASWLAAFPVSDPTARSASDLPETSRQLAAEAVLRASLAIDKRFDDLKQRRDAAVEELEAAILDLPKASEARNDAMVAEAAGQNLLRGLEVYLGNLLTASKSTPLDAQATAEILEASRRVAEAKRDIGPGIGNALSNIAREMPDSVTSNAAILTWIRDRMADKSQPPIMGQAVADFLITQLPGRRGLPIQQVNLSELIGELKQYRDAKALAVQEIDKFRKDTAGVTKTGKGKRVSVKTAAIRYANFREEYRNALTVAKKIDKRVERANEKIQAITLALQVIEETVQSRSYNEKLKDALSITGAIDSAIKLTTGTRGSGGVALNGTASVGNPLTGEQVILNLTPQATDVDEMIEKTFALLQDMDTYLLKPEEEQDPLVAARIEKDKVRLQNMVQGWSPGYLQTMIPKWVPGFGGMTIPSLWTLYHRLPIFGKRLAAPNNIISWIGGPAGRELPPLMAARDIATRSMEMLRADAKGGPSQAKVNLATVAAMKAHGMDVTNSASQQRIKSHFNRIISQAQDAGSTTYKVGDFNAITGLEVLPADMEAVKAQKQLEDAVQKIARDAQAKGLTRSLFYDPLGIEEVISGRSVSRRSANYGLKMSRRANREQTPIINRWALATTQDKKIDILKEHFDTMVLGLILETSPTLALKMDPLDKQLFNSLIEMERNNNLSFTDYDSFLSWWSSERAAETGMTEAEERAESQDRFIGYIDKSASQYGVDHAKKAQGVGTTAALNESRNLPPAVVRALSADNQFTRPRGALHGPSTWYTYDLTGAADQEAYKGSLLNTLAMRELSGWVNLRSAIGSALSTFDSRKKALMDSGVSEGEALKRLRVESREKADTLANEADYATLRDLSEHIDAAIAELSRIMGDTITTPADTGPVRTGRAILGVVGSQLLMPPESMINNTVGQGIMTTVVGSWLNRMRAYAAGPKYFAGMIKDMTGRVLNAAAKKNKPFKAWLKTNGPVVDALNELLAETTLRRDKANAAMTVDEADVLSLVKMIKELPSTYGVIDPGREQGLIEKSLNLLQAGMGVGQLKYYVPARYHSIIDKAATVSAAAPYLLEQSKRIAPGTLDRAGNTAAGPLYIQMLNEPAFKQRMFAILQRREATVPGWDNASSRNFRIPDEMWEGIFAVDNLKFFRDVLAPLGSIEALMVDWYKRVGGRKIAIQSEPFLTPEDEAAATFEFIKLTNMRTESTTPQVVKDKGSVFALWRAALSMFGRFSMNNSGVMERRFARVAGTGEKENKWMAGLATLIMFLAFAIFGMELKGLWKDYGAREPRTAARLEVAVQDPKIAAQYTAAALSSFITYGGDLLGKLAGGSMPSNPFDMTRSVPVLGIGTAAFNGVTTALQTGDPVYPLVDFMRTAFPVTKPLFNRIMEGDAGRREAYRGVRANAPSDIEMRQFSGGGGRATPMQPMIRSAINAYMEGDMEGYQSAYRQAVEYQVGRGKTAKAADQAVRSALAAKDPIMSSVGRTLPDEDVERITKRLSPRQKNAFLRARSLTSSLRKGRTSKRGSSPLRKRRQKTKRRTRRQA